MGKKGVKTGMVPRTAFKLGNKPWTTGKHRTEEEKEKIRNSLRRGHNIDCHKCGKSFYVSPSSKRKYCSRQCSNAGAIGKTISEEHKKILSKIKTGKGNPQYGKRGCLAPNWRGGDAVSRPKRVAYVKKRMRDDPEFRLSMLLRIRLIGAIKKNSQSGSAVRDLGCSIPFLKKFLEDKFTHGMNWDNWGIHGWHIDHIVPLSSFDLSKREELLKAVHYTNLQPLWGVDNLRKGGVSRIKT